MACWSLVFNSANTMMTILQKTSEPGCLCQGLTMHRALSKITDQTCYQSNREMVKETQNPIFAKSE